MYFNPFYVVNGVSQGNVLSHQLLNVSIGDLSVSLTKLQIACNPSDVSTNRLILIVFDSFATGTKNCYYTSSENAEI